MEIDADLVIQNAAEDYAELVRDNWILRAKVALLGARLRDLEPDENEDGLEDPEVVPPQEPEEV